MAAAGEDVTIEELQASGRTLLRHVTKRYDKSLAAGNAPEAGPAGLELLIATPDNIRHGNSFGDLARCVDDLSCRAAPANVSTIRVTNAYLRVEDEKLDPRLIQRAKNLRLVFGLVLLFAALVSALSIFLLFHVDAGRATRGQIEASTKELRRFFDDLTKLPPDAWVTQGRDKDTSVLISSPDNYLDPFLPFCDGEAKSRPDPTSFPEAWKAGWRPPLAAHRLPRGSAEGVQARIACSRWKEAQMREKLVFLQLEQWNCFTDSLFMKNCDTPPGRSDSGIGAEIDVGVSDWKRTELRTAAMISGLAGFLLPMLLGGIGGCAYVLRRLDRKLAQFTLDENDGMHAMLRVLLATMLGGMLGAIWSGDKWLDVGGFTLSLAAIAFFVGFSLEVVFSTVEAMIERWASTLKGNKSRA